MFDYHVHYGVPTPGSPDQLRLQALLAEYSDISKNVQDRVRLVQGVFNYGLLFLTALIPITVQIVDRKVFAMLYVIPWVFCPLAMVILRQDLIIACVTKYEYQILFPQLRAIANSHQSFRLDEALTTLRKSISYAPLAISRYIIFFFPSIGSIVGVAALKHSCGFLWKPADTYLTILGAGMIVFTMLLVLSRSARSYRAIVNNVYG